MTSKPQRRFDAEGVMYQDGDWYLIQTKHCDPPLYYLSHRCPFGQRGIEIERVYEHAHQPCAFCDSECPKELQGLLGMMEYL